MANYIDAQVDDYLRIPEANINALNQPRILCATYLKNAKLTLRLPLSILCFVQA